MSSLQSSHVLIALTETCNLFFQNERENEKMIEAKKKKKKKNSGSKISGDLLLMWRETQFSFIKPNFSLNSCILGYLAFDWKRG